jgi:NAD(P)-dependent dehydrogenase (short-subunit alcohol dehydrogenase family)
MTNQKRFGLAFVLAAGSVIAARVVRSRRAIDFASRSVVIFGGSRGLGLVIARQLAAQGAHVTLVARDVKALERARAEIEAIGGTASTVPCDIRDQQQVESTIVRIVAERGGIDVLFNVAGIISVGPMAHMALEDFDSAMATHFRGPLYTMMAVLPHMRRGGARRIVNIASIGGKVAVPHLLPYSASKFALVGLSEGLHAELAREGITVTTVCPGLMRTGSTYNAQFKGDHEHEFAWFHIAASTPGLSTSAERAARQIIDACRHGDSALILGLPAKVAVALNGVAPDLLSRMLTGANRLLPAESGASGDELRSGWQSATRFTPSAVTRLTDWAAAKNNELPAGSFGR